eukprot:CAMPEP_0182879014 /NCGR_PEP_ID=MMETSP0034_2-20130328/15706_1 /TAXON_ID=156128 /ORGANISM="Nephroselmis pyriformis, Strain CCMP717" /LENGTH=112 /DNA_ID=CAMNT_0025011919 /DNA_START=62 /DNA_END=397 /DNA_ORIENTATION=+
MAPAPASATGDVPAQASTIREMHAGLKAPGPIVENTTSLPTVTGPAATLDGYGQNCFKGAVAAPYLKKHGASEADFKSGAWVKDVKEADKVALALLDWAVERGASSYCHWFQ